VQWIAAIGDEKMRQQSYQNLANNWLNRDAQAARSWIATSPLPQDVKERLLKTKTQ